MQNPYHVNSCRRRGTEICPWKVLCFLCDLREVTSFHFCIHITVSEWFWSFERLSGMLAKLLKAHLQLSVLGDHLSMTTRFPRKKSEMWPYIPWPSSSQSTFTSRHQYTLTLHPNASIHISEDSTVTLQKFRISLPMGQLSFCLPFVNLHTSLRLRFSMQQCKLLNSWLKMLTATSGYFPGYDPHIGFSC